MNRNLWVLSIGWFVSATGFAASLPFIAIYFTDEYGISLTDTGLFFLAMAIVRSVFQAVGGEMADRVPRQFLLVYAQVARSLAFVYIAISIQYNLGFWHVATGLLVNSVFGALFHPVANALVSDILPASRRLDGYAITRSAGNLGWAAGPAIGGFVASTSYATLFWISAAVTLVSALVFWGWLRVPRTTGLLERFRMRDLIAVKDDPRLARHCILVFMLYLVVAQLIVPFSVYSVDIAGITKTQLGYLYTINGLLVVGLQLPITRMLSGVRLTTQLAIGAAIYAFAYTSVGVFVGFGYFVAAICLVTVGEVIMSPPALALTSRMAPKERMGRYMGIFGFFNMMGWSLGPLYGGFFLDRFGNQPATAWALISSLALASALGYLWFGRRLPERLNLKPEE